MALFISEVMSNTILGNERNFISNQKRTDKTNSIPEKSTKIKVSFDFYRFDFYIPHRK